MFALSLRQKLLLVSSLILVVPWLGIRYVKAIEDYLQQVVLENLDAYTQSVATNLEIQVDEIPEFPSGSSVYASPLRNVPTLDGYDADWGGYSNSAIVLSNSRTNLPGPRVKLARYEDTIYLFITVLDQHIRYDQQEFNVTNQSEVDRIELDLVIGSEMKTLSIITEAPGSVIARNRETNQRYSRIQGSWQEREEGIGYQVEFKIPVSYISEGLNITVVDNGQGQSERYSLGADRLSILSTPDSLKALLAEFNMVDGRRLRLLDSEGRMLASMGSLQVQSNLKPVNPLFAWLLIPDAIADPWDGKTSLIRADIESALNGEPVSQRTRVNDNSSMLLSSAWPITDEGNVKAVILIEESTAALQVLQRSALSSLLNTSLIIFVLLAIAFIAFAGRLSNRIRRLETITDSAIDKQGRVQGAIPDLRTGDELDDLNNHIRDMLVRLRAYHDYLEKLASRLSHEIRTPVAVVRSSLETMQHQIDQTDDREIADNLTRANEGVARLQTLLHRMAEATRLEQSIHESHMDTLSVPGFLSQMVKSYSDIYSEYQFEHDTDLSTVQASGDLLAQALDKLVSNATSFAPVGSTIKIMAEQHNKDWQLIVQNTGPALPAGMENQLFQSMVSIRESTTKDGQPHLGLGLHIVQLIAEFHGGNAHAENTEDGVRISLTLQR